MLSKAVYGHQYNRDHRRKLVRFIGDFCSWEHARHVSLQQLALFLKKECPAELIDLKEYTIDSLSRWPTYGPIYLSSDPHLREIKALWPRRIEINGRQVSLDFFRHDNLFYDLRNSFVHENRGKGFSFNIDDIMEPYYAPRMKIVESVDGKESEIVEVFELSHPVAFFKQLLLNALPRMEKYLLINSINPYEHLPFSSEWVSLID